MGGKSSELRKVKIFLYSNQSLSAVLKPYLLVPDTRHLVTGADTVNRGVERRTGAFRSRTEEKTRLAGIIIGRIARIFENEY